LKFVHSYLFFPSLSVYHSSGIRGNPEVLSEVFVLVVSYILDMLSHVPDFKTFDDMIRYGVSQAIEKISTR